MTLRTSMICITFAIAARNTHAIAASFTVTDMLMSSWASSGTESMSEGVYFPTNPFATTHHAQMGLTEATTVYTVLWGDQSGSFDFAFDHFIEDGPDSGNARSGGTLIFTTTEDMVFSYSLDYSYSLSGSTFIATSLFELAEGTPSNNYLVSYFSAGGPGWLEPANGTMLESGQEFLEAGHRYRVTYRTQLTSDGLNSGLVRHGSGSLHFAFTTVPEPASAALLGFAAFALSRRRRPLN